MTQAHDGHRCGLTVSRAEAGTTVRCCTAWRWHGSAGEVRADAGVVSVGLGVARELDPKRKSEVYRG